LKQVFSLPNIGVAIGEKTIHLQFGSEHTYNRYLIFEAEINFFV
jgi:hypothetical protein